VGDEDEAVSCSEIMVTLKGLFRRAILSIFPPSVNFPEKFPEMGGIVEGSAREKKIR